MRGPVGTGSHDGIAIVPHWITRPNQAMWRITVSAIGPAVLSKKTLTPFGQVAFNCGSSGWW